MDKASIRLHATYLSFIAILFLGLVYLYRNPQTSDSTNESKETTIIRPRLAQSTTLPTSLPVAQRPSVGQTDDAAATQTNPPPSGLVYTITDEDFLGKHGIDEEPFEFTPPKTDHELRQFLKGTVWSWGSHPSRDGEVVVFVDEETIYGTWGRKYEFKVPEGEMKVDWPEHEVTFSPDYRFIKVDGKNPRVGKLLKRIEGERLSSVSEDIEGFSKETLKE